MGTVTGYTAAKMDEIANATIIGAHVSGDNLILEKHDGGTIDAGSVRGPTGPTGASPIVCTSTTHPTPFVGLAIWETDTNRYLIYNGVRFDQPWNMPWGFIARSTLSLAGTYLAETTLTSSPAMTINVVANRRLRVSFGLGVYIGATTGWHKFRIKRDGIEIRQNSPINHAAAANNDRFDFDEHIIDTPVAGGHTYTVTAEALDSNPYTVDNTIHSNYIEIEDLGPNGVPV